MTKDQINERLEKLDPTDPVEWEETKRLLEIAQYMGLVDFKVQRYELFRAGRIIG